MLINRPGNLFIKMTKILVLDNYDSFTYNLVHLLEKVCDFEIEVHRNDKIELNEIERFDKILLSPGPGIPSEAGILADVIKTYASTKSILGVCLGHQAIVEAFGGSIKNLDTVFHGVASPLEILIKDFIFHNVPNGIHVGRYHSWVVSAEKLPTKFEITAVDNFKNIMAIRHTEFDLRGVQFHPESILTEYGEAIIKNWVSN